MTGNIFLDILILVVMVLLIGCLQYYSRKTDLWADRQINRELDKEDQQKP